jgi:peptidoglycan/LPS O-acetylase OafA/YrhL
VTPENPAKQNWEYREDLEGIRGIAILMVVLFHAGVSVTSGGFAGVDVFFVLSGFLISGILFEEVRATGSVSLVKFWARRARRLLPAATVTAIGTLIMVAVLASPFAASDYIKTAAAFAVYASNLLFVRRQSDYFARSTVPDPLLHTWTLAVEEQFYIVFAPLVLFLAATARKSGFATFLKRATVACALLSVAAFVANISLGTRYPLLAFYTLPFRAWEFGLGACVAAYLARRPASSIVSGSGWLSLAGIVGIVLTTFIVPESASSHGIALLLPTASTALIILGGRDRRRHLANAILAFSPLRLTGRLSYSWYLWHWPILIGLELINPTASVALRLLACCISLTLASASYALVEQPVRVSRWLASRPRQTLVGAAAAMVLVIGCAVAAIELENRSFRSPAIQQILRAQTAPFIPNGAHCHLTFQEIAPVSCVFGDTASKTTIVLFGDSHAEHWVPALVGAAQRHHWRLVPYTKSGCPSVEVAVARSASTLYPECDSWRRAVLDRLRRDPPAVVLISNAHAYAVHVASEGRLESVVSSRAAQDEWQRGLNALLTELQKLRTRTFVIGDPPTPGFDVPICLSTPARSASSCGFSLTVGGRDSAVALEAPIVQSSSSSEYFDTISLVCDQAVCPPMRNGEIVWRDDNHLSAVYSAALAEPLEVAISAFLERRSDR